MPAWFRHEPRKRPAPSCCESASGLARIQQMPSALRVRTRHGPSKDPLVSGANPSPTRCWPSVGPAKTPRRPSTVPTAFHRQPLANPLAVPPPGPPRPKVEGPCPVEGGFKPGLEAAQRALSNVFAICYTGHCFFRVCSCGAASSLVHGRCGRKDPRKPRFAATSMAHPRGKSHRPHTLTLRHVAATDERAMGASSSPSARVWGQRLGQPGEAARHE